MPAKKKKQKGQGRAKAPDCPVCVVHIANRSKFYEEPGKIGKITASGKCSVCGYVERK